MASVTFDGQSFAIDGRRIWVLGAALDYARLPPEVWAERIAATRQAGFNAVATPCPWMVHEPRKGRFSFQDSTDVRRFVELCGEAGMWVILRPGPFVGAPYDAGGLPSWLLEVPGVSLREANETFLERVGHYFRKLLAEVADLQVTQGGPLLLVQSEHAWLCSNSDQADKYLREVTRYLRENGISVPIFNTNDLWQESVGTIDTWRGGPDLLIQLRQLRDVQPRAPRIVSEFRAAPTGLWGESPDDHTPGQLLGWLAQVLAAGAQPVVSPFHGGTNFGFVGGRLAGRPDGFVTTAAAPSAPLGEAGTRGPKYARLRRLVTFASQFGHVFADLAPDYHPVALDVGELEEAGSKGGRSAARRVSVVHLRGGSGQVVFVFADAPKREATLLLEQGIRLPVALGEQSVGWYLVDVDLRGAGRLDYTNLMPWAVVGRVLVLFGPARTTAYVSIDGSPLEAAVPAGSKPVKIEHKGVSLLLCSTEQIDRTYHDHASVYVSVAGLTPDGAPIPLGRSTRGWVIGQEEGDPQPIDFQAAPPPAGRAVPTAEWEASPATAYVRGDSPRYATLDGPRTLTSCGAALGYGWYRIQLKVPAARKRRLHLPEVADRAHLYLDGEPLAVVGVGRGADHRPFEHYLGKGEHTLVALVDNLGRFAEGNDLGERKGLFGHLRTVKRLVSVRPKKVEAAVDPFTLRGYIAGRTRGQLSDTAQLSWSFTHARKTPILVDLDGAEASGTLVLNDQPLSYYAGASGGCLARLLLVPGLTPEMKRGKNELRFAPDLRQADALDAVARCVTLYECVESPSDGAAWAFAKWELPAASSYRPISRTAARDVKGGPCWWRTSFEVDEAPLPLRLDTAGLSKGQAFVNGENLGRYFTATADGKAVGPQKWMYVPRAWVRVGEPNELIVFDEHGFPPHRTSIAFSDD